MRSGVCTECGGSFEHHAITGRVPNACSAECRRVRRNRLASTPERRARVAAWHAAHPTRVAEIKQKWLENNPEKRRIASSEWTKRNRRQASEQTRRYRAIKAARTLVAFTPEQLDQRMAMFAGCWICGRTDVPLEVDHVKPVSLGGAHVLSNIRPACRSCNASKGNVWPPEDLTRLPSIAAALGIG